MRAQTMTEDECTEARDPLKMVQLLTAEEGCSENEKKEVITQGPWIAIVCSYLWSKGHASVIGIKSCIFLTCRAGDGRSDVTKVWLK